jgi:hypothetical protein
MIWRVLQEGFFNNVRGCLWKKCRRRCELCKQAPETTEHQFFSCLGPNRRWVRLLELLESTKLNLNDCTSLFDVLTLAINRSKRSPTMLLIVAESLQASWLDRVNRGFRQVHSHVLVYVVVRNVIEHIDAMVQMSHNSKKVSRLTQERNILLSAMDQMLGTWTRFRTTDQQNWCASSSGATSLWAPAPQN